MGKYREEKGTFENFKSYGDFENFRKTTATAMWESHRLSASH
jgi:hypothetical protein